VNNYNEEKGERKKKRKKPLGHVEAPITKPLVRLEKSQ
jgi:hypothetical protein